MIYWFNGPDSAPNNSSSNNDSVSNNNNNDNVSIYFWIKFLTYLQVTKKTKMQVKYTTKPLRNGYIPRPASLRTILFLQWIITE